MPQALLVLTSVRHANDFSSSSHTPGIDRSNSYFTNCARILVINSEPRCETLMQVDFYKS